MNKNVEKRVDSLSIMVLLTLSGGMQDAYTYFTRHSVFANGQTGNIVLLMNYLFSKDMKMTIHYLIPVMSYALGILLAETIEGHKKDFFHFGGWQHTILSLEILLLFIVGLLPDSYYHMANALVSFSCALQVEAFRTVRGYSYASTMCVGNIKLGMSALSKAIRLKERKEIDKALHYFFVILTFALGAGIGALLSRIFLFHAIWFSSFILLLTQILLAIPAKSN